MKRFLFFLLCLLSFSCFALEFAEADIVLPAAAPPQVRLAAKELSRHLHLMTGKEFPIVTNASSGKVHIFLGDSELARKCGAELSTLKDDGFFLGSDGKDVFISGVDTQEHNSEDLFSLLYEIQKKGTLYGAYEFLEQQGIRWPAPGEKSLFIPRHQTVKIADGIQKQNPTFADRETFPNWKLMAKHPDLKEYISHDEEFYLWLMRLRYRGRPLIPTTHAAGYLPLKQAWWETHPERFQLKNGKRNPAFLCWTDPAVKEMWFKCADAYLSGRDPAETGLPISRDWPGQLRKGYFCIEPDDHQAANDGTCDCPRCTQFRKDHPSRLGKDTEIMWTVIADVADRIKVLHPEAFIFTCIYPPKEGVPQSVKIPSNVKVRYAPIGAAEQVLPERFNAELDVLKTWSAIVGRDNISLRTYQIEAHGRKVPGIPDIYPGLQIEYLKQIRNLCCGVENEIVCHSHTSRNLDVYMMSRFLWNLDRDPETEFREYYTMMYGPAAKPMRELFTRFEENYKSYHRQAKKNVSERVGVAGDGGNLRRVLWMKVYTDEEIAKLDALIAEAEKAAKDDPEYTRRIQLVKTNIIDVMKGERKEVVLPPETPSLFLKKGTASESLSLVSADLPGAPKVPTTFTVTEKDNRLDLLIHWDEPDPAQCLCADRKNGDPKIYQDDDMELFLFSKGKVRHILVNSKGAYSCRELSARGEFWRIGEDVKISLQAVPHGRELRISLDLPADTFQLNVARSRRLKDGRTEYSVWSPAARSSWQTPALWGKITIH